MRPQLGWATCPRTWRIRNIQKSIHMGACFAWSERRTECVWANPRGVLALVAIELAERDVIRWLISRSRERRDRQHATGRAPNLNDRPQLAQLAQPRHALKDALPFANQAAIFIGATCTPISDFNSRMLNSLTSCMRSKMVAPIGRVR